MIMDILKRVRHSLSIHIEDFFSLLIAKMPLKEIIVLECESDLDDNPRAFYEYLIKKGWNKNHKIVWVVKDVDFCRKNYASKNVVFLSRIKGDLRNRIRLNYYFTLSHYFVFSHPYWYYKRRPEQIVLSTGHGTPIKNVSKTDNPNLEKCYDWRLVPTEDIRPWLRKWGCPYEKMHIGGYPRLDELYQGDKREIMTKLFNYKESENVIICLPTYKKSYHKTDGIAEDRFSLDVIEDEYEYKALNEYIKGLGIHLLIKPHPLQRIEGLWLQNLSNIHYINNKMLLEKHIILYQLIGCCDALITDLSSVIYDYLLIDKPIGLLTGNYKNYTRGFIIDNVMDYLPGTEITNYEELKIFLDSCVNGKDLFKERRNIINRIVNKLPPGHYCKELYQWLIDSGN